MLTRRHVFGVAGASVALPRWRRVAQQASEWGSPVFDLRFHMRGQPAATLAHLDGLNPPASRLTGKCVARETLTILKRSTTDGVFRKITWDNVHTLLGIPK